MSSVSKVPRLEEDCDDVDDEEYDQSVRELKHEMKRGHPRSGKIKELMDKTKSGRRKWIKTSKPSSLELIEMFPFLCVEKWVSVINWFLQYK